MMIGSYHFYALNSKNYKRFKRIHNEATNPDGGYTGSIPAERALYFRNVYRRYRDYSVVAIVGSYLLQVIDANVFAYMLGSTYEFRHGSVRGQRDRNQSRS